MNTTFETRFARTVLAAAIAGIFSAPAAWAQEEDEVERLIRPDSEIEAGLGYVSDDSYKYGDYTGLQRSGTHVIGNVLINKRDEDSARYIELEGRNLGLDSRSLGLRAGEQGNYGLRLEYDQIPKLRSDSYQTPYNGAGTTVLTVPLRPADPTGVARSNMTTGMTGLTENMDSVDIGTKRKRAGLGFNKQLSREWDVEMNYKRQEKDGTKLTGAMVQGSSGASRGTTILPEPIDYVTDQYEALVRYTGEKMQLQFGYYASLFENDNKSVTWTNLFNFGTTFGNLTGSYGLPPDNEFHQVNAAGSYAFSPTTRLSGNLSFGRMTQNDAFLPYSTAGQTATAAFPDNRSLNGKVYTTNASMRLTTKLMPKLSLTAGLRYDDRDNKTPEGIQYRYITGDSTAGIANVGSGTDRRNIALDINKQVLYADLDYHLAAATTLKFGYDFHKVKHNYEPTTGDKEHTVKAEVRQQFGETVSAGLSYAHSDRDASDYLGRAPLASTYSQTYLNSLVTPGGKTTGWLEAPTLRKYYLADRKRDKVGLSANYAPLEQLDLQFGAHYNRDKYPDTDVANGIGLTKATGWMLSFDATVRPTDALSGSFFASLDQYKTNQRGAHLPAALVDEADSGAIPAANLVVTTLTDKTLTLGLGVNYKPVRKYEVGANFTHSDSVGRSEFAVVGGTPATGFSVGPAPDLESRLNRLDLYGRYFVQKDLTLNLMYAYERYSSADWAWDAPLTLTSVTSVVGTEQRSPKYNVHFIGVSMAYKF